MSSTARPSTSAAHPTSSAPSSAPPSSFARASTIVRWLVPLGTGAAVILLWGHESQGVAPLVVATFAGAMLGWAIVLAVDAVLAMAGLRAGASRVSARRLLRLERDKVMLLRSIKEIEFDASLQRLSQEEAAELSAPLRAKALRLLRELDEARAQTPLTVEEQIERELTRRLGEQGGKA